MGYRQPAGRFPTAPGVSALNTAKAALGLFARDGAAVILLLTGGDKASQRRDVQLARKFWSDYLEAKRHGEAQ